MPVELVARPWADCEAAERPCALACRYALPDGACVLDVADAGPLDVGAVAARLRLPVETVRQAEAVGLVKLRRALA